MDHQRSSRSQRSIPASSSLIPRHICSRCGKSRSKRYHNHHPLLSGQVPEPGICSRSKCAMAVNDIVRSPFQVIVYETHYHYLSSSGLEGPPPRYTTGQLQLPDNSSGLFPVREESPPPMDISSGPQETPSNSTTGELFGESSLAGRVELPDNRYSRRRHFTRLSPITEELPPPVNLLNKPTQQKKNYEAWKD